ncbi:glycosyltransferase family 87 protein [Actinoplanes sp. CA-054009]
MPATTPVRVSAVAALAAVAAAWHVWYGNRHGFSDLRIYYEAVRWWSQGHSLYDFWQPDPVQHQLGFTYPPFAALVLYPAAWLGWNTTITVMLAISVTALVVTTIWLGRPVARRHGRPLWFVLGLALPVITWLEPIRETITFGQVNLILAALVLFDLLVLMPRGSRLTGVAIGIASAVKLTPAVFILYLLVTRRFRAAAVAAGTAAAATLAAAAWNWPDSWRYWTSVVWNGAGIGSIDRIPNQSLLGALSRLAHPQEPPRLAWALLAAAVLVVGLTRAARAARAGDEVAALALVGCAGALISPVSWQHHLYWFVPALVVLVDVAASRQRHSRRYGLFAALITATITWSVIAWHDHYAWMRGIEHTPIGLALNDWETLLMLAILAVLPFRPAGLEPVETPSQPAVFGEKAA